jgi:hypothetical protein
MFNRYWIYSGRYRKVLSAIVLCLYALVAAPTASYSSARKGVQCTLTEPASHTAPGQTISIDITVINTSSQTLFVPWPPETRHLLEWGVLSVSVEDESGNIYKYVPVPARFFLRQRSHYQRLTLGDKISNSLNLCMFRDINYSHSPCSRPGKYVVRVTYSNHNAEYWDAGTNEMMKLNKVWTGESMCNEIKIEVVAKK